MREICKPRNVMLRIVIVALVTLEIVLLSALTLSPANATTSDLETYVWSYAGVGNHEVVCKQLVIHPQKQLKDRSSKRQVMKMSSGSKIVNDSYCANSAKPYQVASQPHQD